MLAGSVNQEFWKNKKVFLTGHNGFKGSWLSLWLQQMGAVVKGFSLPPLPSPSLYQLAKIADEMEYETGDVRDFDAVRKSIDHFQPDIVFHLAAQPLVRASYRDPISTFSTNLLGLVNVLEATRNCQKIRSIINVTSDKCYENKGWVWPYRETDEMGGHDPYSSSKGCAELISVSFRRSFFSCEKSPSLATARAGNVIGGGDFAEDRLIPDLWRAVREKKELLIRYPNSTRPWQHVLEPLSGYLMLAEKLFLRGDEYAQGWNFGPLSEDVKSVQWVLEYLDSKMADKFIWRKEKSETFHEAALLSLDISKSRKLLGWHPRWNVQDALDKTIEWENCYAESGDIKRFTLGQIRQFQN